MSIKEKYKVISIDSYLCKDWLLYKHYAKRIPSISYSFGLYNIENVLQGIVTYGMPPSPTLSESICGKNYKNIVLELNRLITNEGLEKNVLSFFVSKSLIMLPKPNIIVSFSDANMYHNGYIYQACNFVYTGLSSNLSKLVDKYNKEFHFRNIGHYQKNNKLKVNLIKKRVNEDLINKIELATYLKNNKGNFKAKELDKIFNYKDTCSHWFRLDAGFSFPNIEDYIKLKNLLNLDNTFDKQMLEYELIADSNEIIKKLELKKVEILPKHRYIYINANKYDKINILRNLKLSILPFPKGENKKYNTNFDIITQKILF